jgi:hypothetical protein
MKKVSDILQEAATTFAQRNAIYGDNYKNFGHVMHSMFPDGFKVNSPDDWNRLGIFVQIVSKVTRYAAAFDNGGHQDSAHDACVYSAMLEELTK